MKVGGAISIWFFVGISFLVNGILIFASGVYELMHPPVTPVVLFHFHAGIWWGALLAVLGGIYSFHYWPWKSGR